MKYIDNTPIIQWKSLKDLNEKQTVILLTSPSAEKVVKPFIKQLKIKTKLYISASQKKEAVSVAKNKPVGEIIYAIGGGGVIDVGRYLANVWDLNIICVPTIISSDAFLVNCTGLRENGCVDYVPSKKADTVIFDYEILKKADKHYHISGCCDVLSIFTGIEDWKYANKKKKNKTDEIYSESISIIAKNILNALLADKEEIKKGSQKGLETIVCTLAMEVLLCNFYGNSRPEEGGEHFFAYCIENHLSHFLHGEMVGFGILLTSYIQGQDWKKIKSFMDYVGYKYFATGLNRELVKKVLIELPTYVVENNLRYSVYNDFNYEKNKEFIEKFLGQVGLKK